MFKGDRYRRRTALTAYPCKRKERSCHEKKDTSYKNSYNSYTLPDKDKRSHSRLKREYQRLRNYEKEDHGFHSGTYYCN